MNRLQILQKVARTLNKSDPLDTRTQTRLLDAINSRHREILSCPGCQGLRRRQITIDALAGRARYALRGGEAIRHVIDRTNDFELTQRSLGTYRQYNPDPVQNPGTPDGFIVYGFEPVELQPQDITNANVELFIKSSSAADTTQLAYVESIYQPGAGVTLTGTTRVSLGFPHRGYINKFYLSAPSVGLVQLEMDVSGITYNLAYLSGETSVRYLVFYLDPTPSQSLPYLVDAEFIITDLATDTEAPWLPSDFHDLLVTGVVMDELTHTDDGRLVVLQQQYHQRLGDLKLKLARQGTDSGPRGMNSRLGSWAPRTSW